jgi:hypothetical protein
MAWPCLCNLYAKWKNIFRRRHESKSLILLGNCALQPEEPEIIVTVGGAECHQKQVML